MKLMKSIAAVAAAALLMMLLPAPTAHALPQGAVYNYYYDADWNLIGEKDILCSGAHYTWGVTTGAAHMSGYSESCSTGQGQWRCYYWDDGCGCYVEVDLTYCGV